MAKGKPDLAVSYINLLILDFQPVLVKLIIAPGGKNANDDISHSGHSFYVVYAFARHRISFCRK